MWVMDAKTQVFILGLVNMGLRLITGKPLGMGKKSNIRNIAPIFLVFLVGGAVVMGGCTTTGLNPGRDAGVELAEGYKQHVQNVIDINMITIESWPHTSGYLRRLMQGKENMLPGNALTAWEMVDALALAYDTESKTFDVNKIPDPQWVELSGYTLFSMETNPEATQKFTWGYNIGAFQSLVSESVLEAIRLFAPDVWGDFVGMLPAIIAGSI
jgi:hypothetical protein